jgi:ATP-dependent DNA ligase
VRHAFVATDLLWLDGEPLLEVPLLERKRLLGTVLEESFLVRVTAFVRPSAVMTLVTWGALGFGDLSYRSANSRYLPGRENPDWAVGRPPEGPHGPVKPPTPPR